MILEQIEIVSNLSFHFHSIKQEQELRLNSSIEVHFNLRSGIAINHHVVESTISIAKILVVLLDFLAVWVPSRTEVYAGKSWSSLVEMLNTIVETSWNDIVFADIGMHTSFHKAILLAD